MTSGISTPLPSLPSLQQESTLEEDYFDAFPLDLLDDEETEASSSSSGKIEKDFQALPTKATAREARMNAAFENSKRMWRAEHAHTESGWYIGLNEHPYHYETSQGKCSGPDAVHTKIIEANITHLYTQSLLPEAFNLSLSLVLPSSPIPKTGEPSSAASSSKSTISVAKVTLVRYSEDMDLDWIRPSKEIVDGMLRIVERIGSGRWKRRRMGSSHEQDGAMNETDNIDEEEEMARDARVWGGVIADSNKATWQQGSNGTMAEIVATCYLLLCRHTDAFVAISYAISDRGLLRPFTLVLQQVLGSWLAHLDSISEAGKAEGREALDTLRECVDYIRSTSTAGDKPLFSSPNSHSNTPPSLSNPATATPTLTSPPSIPPTYLPHFLSLLPSLGIPTTATKDTDAVKKMLKRVANYLEVRRKSEGEGSGEGEGEDGVDLGRSVRNL